MTIMLMIRYEALKPTIRDGSISEDRNDAYATDYIKCKCSYQHYRKIYSNKWTVWDVGTHNDYLETLINIYLHTWASKLEGGAPSNSPIVVLVPSEVLGLDLGIPYIFPELPPQTFVNVVVKYVLGSVSRDSQYTTNSHSPRYR